MSTMIRRRLYASVSSHREFAIVSHHSPSAVSPLLQRFKFLHEGTVSSIVKLPGQVLPCFFRPGLPIYGRQGTYLNVLRPAHEL